MRRRLSTAPTWALVLLNGVPFGVATGVYMAATATSLTFAGRLYIGIVLGTIGGLCVGLLLARLTRSRMRSEQVAMADVPDALRPIAVRSAWSGPAPADPTLRRAALRVIEDARELNSRRRRLTTIGLTCFCLLYLALAATASPWWWPCFALFVGILALHLTSRRRIDRRVAVLSGETPSGE